MAWRRRNLERDQETVRRYVERNRPLIQQRDRSRYQRDRDKRISCNRYYYEADKAKRVEQVRQWRLANPAAAAEKGVRDRARRRARLRKLPHEAWTEQEIIERDGLVCWMCGVAVGVTLESARRDWAIDHLIPIAINFEQHPGDAASNLAIACHPCNRSKANKLLPMAVARYRFNLARQGVSPKRL